MRELETKVSVDTCIKIGHLNITIKEGSHYPYLSSVFVGDIWSDKDRGAYMQLQDLIDDLMKVQQTLQELGGLLRSA